MLPFSNRSALVACTEPQQYTLNSTNYKKKTTRTKKSNVLVGRVLCCVIITTDEAQQSNKVQKIQVVLVINRQFTVGFECGSHSYSQKIHKK
ncbi:hypothetical protein Q1695_014769 [Nippostrongylus brasiliensis]|nr:hypothetical protein Q1695_014769 [Nippostrongylus brasiliensis]